MRQFRLIGIGAASVIIAGLSLSAISAIFHTGQEENSLSIRTLSSLSTMMMQIRICSVNIATLIF